MAIAVGEYTEYSNGTQKSLYRIGIVISIAIYGIGCKYKVYVDMYNDAKLETDFVSSVKGDSHQMKANLMVKCLIFSSL